MRWRSIEVLRFIGEIQIKTASISLTSPLKQLAARVSDYTAFLYLGELIETGDTRKIFTTPAKKRQKTISPAGSVKNRPSKRRENGARTYQHSI
jgi:ABC-type phosphate transport system ATPase subunit